MMVQEFQQETQHTDTRRGWAWGATAAGAALALSEVVERLGGGLTPASYAVTIAAFAGIAATAWVLHLGHRHRAGRFGLVAVALFTVGAALEAVVDVVGFGEPDLASLQAATGLLGAVAGPLLVIGTVAFGAAVLRAGVYPRWTGLVAVLTPWLLVGTSFGLPTPVASVGNMVLGMALAAMGLRLARTSPSFR